MNHRQNLALQVANLEAQKEVLQRRNAELRSTVERLVHGEPAPWTEFEEATAGVAGNGRAFEFDGNLTIWVNSRYQVTVFNDSNPDSAGDVELYHLSIKRLDGAAVHDWRDFQRIKNELIGTDAEAVELYPAEERLVDGANQYHLYAMRGAQFPFGFNSRLVSEENANGVQQRGWTDEERPKDMQAFTAEELDQMHKIRYGSQP